jgi:hypothetical protein
VGRAPYTLSVGAPVLPFARKIQMRYLISLDKITSLGDGIIDDVVIDTSGGTDTVKFDTGDILVNPTARENQNP